LLFPKSFNSLLAETSYLALKKEFYYVELLLYLFFHIIIYEPVSSISINLNYIVVVLKAIFRLTIRLI
jgi:hypothetical protein